MSVSVSIDIAGGMAHRWMRIELQSTPKLDEKGHRLLDEVGTYRVLMGNRPNMPPQAVREAEFEHRYGDDVTILIAKAGAAIREKYDRL